MRDKASTFHVQKAPYTAPADNSLGTAAKPALDAWTTVLRT